MMALRPFQFTIRRLIILSCDSAFLLWDRRIEPGAGMMWLGAVGMVILSERRAIQVPGIVGAIIAGCIIVVGIGTAVLVEGFPVRVSDDTLRILLEFAAGFFGVGIVGAALHSSIALAKQAIDKTPLQDDSCGPIVCHRLDER
jgi:hypothetical protein